MTTAYVLGLDIGSTFVKGLVVDDAGAPVLSARRQTPWTSLPGGLTELTAAVLVATVRDLLDELADEVTALAVDARIISVGVSGMAESGVLLEPHDGTPLPWSHPWDNVVHPIIAWFDTRGAETLAAVPADVAEQFPGRTGLPFGTLATFTKLLSLRAAGVELTGRQWLGVPELVAHALGGARLSEPSLVARTGLVDQDTGMPWQAALDVLGVGPDFLAPIAPAGTVWGHVGDDAPPALRGAVVGVAGHDHVVASVAAGVLSSDQLYCSMGTAEALVRVLDHPLDAAARHRLASHGVNVVGHMLPGKAVMLAGTRSGLLMRRVLQLVGINDAAGRAVLDDAVMALAPDATRGLSVTGGDNAEGVLAVRADADGLSPAALFAATLTHSSDLLAQVLDHMDAEVEPARRTVVAGGWSGMQSVRRARVAALPDVTFSGHAEDTAQGAALVAAFLADPSAEDLTSFAATRRAIDPSTTTEGTHR